MENLKNKLLKCMLQEELIVEEDIEYWDYKMDMMSGKILHAFIVVVNIFISGNVISFLGYVFFFYILRMNTGGFHASSRRNCIILSIVWYLAVNLFLIPALSGIGMYELILFIIASTGVILKYAPVNHPNIQLNISEYRLLKRNVKIILLFEIIIIVLFMFMRHEISISLSLAIITCAVFIIVSKITKQEVEVSEET